MAYSPEFLASVGLGPPVHGAAKPGPHLWADAELHSLYYSVNREVPVRPALPIGEWEPLDATIDAAIAELHAGAELTVAFLLTDESAEERSSITYVFFEPLAHIVVALNHRERDISITADGDLRRAREYDFWRLTNRVEQQLQDGRLPDALRHAAEGLRDIFLPAAAP
jgi:hypothetical protein